MPPSDEVLVHARGLTKRFGEFTAVNAIDFDVRVGEAFGFLGPNGAGKTSTMRMIACASPVTAGELTVIGMDPRRDAPQIKARLGVVPQLDNLDAELTVRENLEMYARYFDIPDAVASARADELLDFVQLSERATDQVEPLSGGMKRRLTIARSLINEPELIILWTSRPPAWIRRRGTCSGSGLPPQAARRDADHHHPLHGRGRAALRPAGRDGQGRDRRRGIAGELIEQYATREVLELRFADAVQRAWTADWTAWRRASRRSPTAILLYVDDGERARRGPPARADPGERHWCAAPRWRTSSCASPGGR